MPDLSRNRPTMVEVGMDAKMEIAAIAPEWNEDRSWVVFIRSTITELRLGKKQRGRDRVRMRSVKNCNP